MSTCCNFRTELCRFSGAKIYPGKGIRFVRADSQVFFNNLMQSFDGAYLGINVCEF